MITAIVLLAYMRRFYLDEFKAHKWSIIIYTLAAMSTNIFYLIRNYQLRSNNDHPNYVIDFDLLYMGGVRFTIQALAFIFLKRASDPLSGLNQLEYTLLFSQF